MITPGQVVDGRYRIQKVLGEGGFGTTYLAENLTAANRVVVKVLNRDTSEQGRELFRKEAAALTRIESTHVARVWDLGELEDGRPYLVFEYLDGLSLAQVLTSGPLQLEESLDVAEAVADALSAAHKKLLIHRDIKPSNVLIPFGAGALDFRQAKLLDFGVRGELKASTNLTRTGEFFGTPGYMAPEQLQATAQSPATDVYGLGVLLYEMLFGRIPFEGKSVTEVLVKTMREDFMLPEKPALPEGVRLFLARSLSKRVEDRPASGTEALVLIQQLRRSAPAQAIYPPGVPSSEAFGVPSVVVAPAPALPPLPKPPNQVSGRPAMNWLLIISISAALFTIALAIVWGKSGKGGAYVIGIIAGACLVEAGIVAGVAFHNWLNSRKSEIEKEADQILLGAQSMDALTRSLAIEVEEILARVRQLDERILARSLAIMWKEFEVAKESKDKQGALMNVVQIFEKLTVKLSPWYVRHDKLVATVVSSVGIVSGLVTILMNVAKMAKGQ